MDKFCIVKRRKQSPPTGPEPVRPPETTAHPALEGTPSPPPQPAQTEGERVGAPLEEATPVDDGQLIKIVLSPEECKAVREDATFKQLLGRIVGGASLEMGQGPEGQIVFNVRIKQVYGTRMLSPENVCEMLQAGKGLLAKLVREGKIKSYKVGRLRRFMLEDVLEYLTGMASETVSETKTEKLRGGGDESPGKSPVT